MLYVAILQSMEEASLQFCRKAHCNFSMQVISNLEIMCTGKIFLSMSEYTFEDIK